MKIFARITAIFAVLLIMLSVLLLIITTIFQGPIAGLFCDLHQIMPQWLKTWRIRIPWQAFLTCFAQMICIAPVIFLAGRKKGGIWIEIVLFVLLLFCIPALNRLVETVDFVAKVLDWYGDPARFLNIRKLLMYGAYYELGWSSINVMFKEVPRWCMEAATVGRLFGLMAIGASMAGVATQRKEKKAAKRLENQPDAATISQ